MNKLLNDISGFSLIEVLVLIVVIGIAASTAMQWMTTSIDDIRRTKTEREMEMLTEAITGNPKLTAGGKRSDFGYIGDVGAFPPNLQALYQNPGGYSTWDGPYISTGFSQDSTGFKYDEWGTAYSYTGGVTIASTGGGTAITKIIADAADDYLLNQFNGTIIDSVGNVPGTTFLDSVDIVITFPNGSGGTTSKTYNPDSAGTFTLDSIPVGTHPFRLIYTPMVDTIFMYLTILPRNKSSKTFKFTVDYFASGGGTTTTIEIQLTSDRDDAEEDDGGGMSRNNDKLELGQMEYVGFRFQNITIPQGATISSAYVEFRAADGNTENTDITIWGQDIDDASQFSNGSNNISNRTKTSASAIWNNVENWSNNQTYQCPDISNVIQEIINRGGWSSGNDLVVMFESTDLNGKRYIVAHDDNPSNAGLLHVEYEN